LRTACLTQRWPSSGRLNRLGSGREQPLLLDSRVRRCPVRRRASAGRILGAADAARLHPSSKLLSNSIGRSKKNNSVTVRTLCVNEIRRDRYVKSVIGAGFTGACLHRLQRCAREGAASAVPIATGEREVVNGNAGENQREGDDGRDRLVDERVRHE